MASVMPFLFLLAHQAGAISLGARNAERQTASPLNSHADFCPEHPIGVGFEMNCIFPTFEWQRLSNSGFESVFFLHFTKP